MIRVKVADISKLGRSTQGVKVMNVADDDRVTALARMQAKKKAAPKRDENQLGLDLGTDETERVDIGGEEEIDDDLLDEE